MSNVTDSTSICKGLLKGPKLPTHRYREVLEMRAQGHSLDAIGKHFGVKGVQGQLDRAIVWARDIRDQEEAQTKKGGETVQTPQRRPDNSANESKPRQQALKQAATGDDPNSEEKIRETLTDFFERFPCPKIDHIELACQFALGTPIEELADMRGREEHEILADLMQVRTQTANYAKFGEALIQRIQRGQTQAPAKQETLGNLRHQPEPVTPPVVEPAQKAQAPVAAPKPAAQKKPAPTAAPTPVRTDNTKTRSGIPVAVNPFRKGAGRPSKAELEWRAEQARLANGTTGASQTKKAKA